MKETGVIIVSWNSKKYLKDCLDSIFSQDYEDFQLYVVDNNSSDNSLEIAEADSRITIIRNNANYGFAKGNNVGIERAIKEGCRYIVFVNFDVIADKKWLSSLVEKAKTDNKIGAVQSKILIGDTGLINTTGNVLHYLGFSYCGNYKKSSDGDYQKNITVASGASLLIKTEVLKKIGYFDEDFFLYFEDTDLTWRTREAGYEIVFEPSSIIKHYYSFSRNKNKMYYSERNRLFFIFKNYDARTLLLLFPALILTELLMLGFSLLSGWFIEKIKGYVYLISNLRLLFKKRKETFNKKTIRDRELKKYFSQSLKFEEINNPLFPALNLFYKMYWKLINRLI